MSDAAQIEGLASWMIEQADIVSSLAKQYAEKLVMNGIASVPRLSKKLAKDSAFLLNIGVDEDDAEEIIEALKR